MARKVKQPKSPMPAQHQRKPGIEAKLKPRPNYEAPLYAGAGKLKEKVALITGGDSGIGRAVAVLFAREGADIAFTYLRSEKQDAEETKRAIESEGQRAYALSGDVRDPKVCKRLVKKTVDEFGKLDILVNNAAFQEHTESIEELTDEHFDLTFRTNVYGSFYMTRAAMPHLKQGGSIINTTSETGIFGEPSLLDYSATKGALNAFTKALATNLADRGIRVNAVAPGPIDTPLLNAAPEQLGEIGERLRAGMIGATSMRRIGQPEEVAAAIAFLASDDASFVTGQTINVSGGLSMA
jgi:NAD(P)-dependent dehydrogenase (short-subunit alcohol dehydrogenase family)